MSSEKKTAHWIGNKGRNSALAVFRESLTWELAAVLNSFHHCSREQHPGSVDNTNLFVHIQILEAILLVTAALLSYPSSFHLSTHSHHKVATFCPAIWWTGPLHSNLPSVLCVLVMGLRHHTGSQWPHTGLMGSNQALAFPGHSLLTFSKTNGMRVNGKS